MIFAMLLTSAIVCASQRRPVLRVVGIAPQALYAGKRGRGADAGLRRTARAAFVSGHTAGDAAIVLLRAARLANSNLRGHVRLLCRERSLGGAMTDPV